MPTTSKRQFLIMIKEGHQMGMNEPERLNHAMRQGERVIESLIPGIETAITLGILRPLPPNAIAHMIMGNVKGYQMHMCLEGCRSGAALFGGQKQPASELQAPEQSAKFIATFLLDGIVQRG